MLNIKLRTAIILLVLGIVGGIALTALFKGCNESKQKAIIISTKQIKQQAAKSDTAYNHNMAILDHKKDSLTDQTVVQKYELYKAEQKSRTTETNIRQVMQRKPLSASDSLQGVVEDYIEGNQQKDSVAKATIVTLDSVVALKDVVIEQKETRFQQYDSLLNLTIIQQDILQTENNSLAKELKHRKRNSKLVSLFVLILSGVAVSLLL